MISALARPLLASGAALAVTGALVLAPQPALPAVPEVPTVHVAEVNLAGIGQDIYYAITPVVQYAVGGVSYLINFIPLIGGPIAAQININYFQLVQPVVEATVNYAAAVVQNPLGIIDATAAYGSTLYDIGYNWVSAELVFFGLGPLPPLPPTAAVRTPSPASVSRAAARAASAEAVTAPADPEVPELINRDLIRDLKPVAAAESRRSAREGRQQPRATAAQQRVSAPDRAGAARRGR